MFFDLLPRIPGTPIGPGHPISPFEPFSPYGAGIKEV